MAPYERLTAVFDRAMREGLDGLSTTDRELYLIQDFIIESEMNGLSGYFYNRLPDVGLIEKAVEAMRRWGLADLASILSESLELFLGYVEPDPPTTWGEILRQYDPA